MSATSRELGSMSKQLTFSEHEYGDSNGECRSTNIKRCTEHLSLGQRTGTQYQRLPLSTFPHVQHVALDVLRVGSKRASTQQFLIQDED